MGIIMWATVEAKRRLSELVTLIGRVSETRPVCFLRVRKRGPWLKPWRRVVATTQLGQNCKQKRSS